MQPLISVIVPVYRAEEYIEPCIQSMLRQSDPDWELLLVDDGSPDQSGAVCDRYAGLDSRIQAFHTPNAGVSAARNYGLDRAKGEYICFLDSDDLLAPKHLTLLRRHIVGADVAVCGFQTFDDPPRKHIQDQFTNRIRRHAYTLEELKKDILHTGFSKYIGSACNKLFRRSLIEQHNLRFSVGQKTGQDALFCMQYLSLVQKISCFPARTYLYRYREGSTYHQYREGYLEYRLTVQEAYDRFFGLTNASRPILQCYRFGRLLDTLTQASLKAENPAAFLKMQLERTGLSTALDSFKRPCVCYYRFMKPNLTPSLHRKLQLLRDGRLEEYLSRYLSK
ncbi:MAG: glycosyltransferase family 2 protein [Eubacteriales bacterium]|nr:glycosyltransferase family 2 protein [Eubacteriales bacterium]